MFARPARTATAAILFASVSLGQAPPAPVAQRFEVVHEGFDVLSRGEMENAGENLYVSRKGRVQLIHRWDLNNDGYYDLVFSNTHNSMVGAIDALGYLQTHRGFQSVISPLYRSIALYDLWLQEEKSRATVLRFPAERPASVLLHDVDGDGLSDLIFACLGPGDTENHRSVVYWGMPGGYKRDLRLELDTVGASDVAVADLNLDGYQDIVFANRGRPVVGLESAGSYIYWGSGERHGTQRRTVVATGAAVSCAIGDLDGDGYPDLVFAASEDELAGLIVYRGSEAGPDLRSPVKLPLRGIASVRIADSPDLGAVIVAATGSETMCYGLGPAGLIIKKQAKLAGKRAVVADLDGDRQTDLVVAGGDHSAILWGKHGWSAEHATLLPTLDARDVRVADLDRKGGPEIVFANYSEGLHGDLDVPSYVYWSRPWGYGVEARTELQTFGASAVEVGDINHDGRLDLIFGNTGSGINGGKNETIYVYWGRPHRGYSTAAMASYPAVMPMSTALADLDDDGNAEMLVANSGRHYMNEPGSSYLYWGTPKGPALDRRQEFRANEVGSWAVADLNRDGYLDAVACDFDSILIVWGAAEARAASPTRIDKVANAAQICRLVDFDRDGWLDILVTDIRGPRNRVLLGGKQGYQAERCVWIDDGNVSNVEFADLNHDGFLDMVLLRSYVVVKNQTDRNNSWLRIRYGGPNGFETQPAVEFPAFGAFDVAIADLDADGDLDIALSQYQSRDRRNLPVFLFWNDGRGNFSARNRTVLPAEGPSGLLAADFDEDGRIDLLVVNHKTSYKEDNHNTESHIFWGSEGSFSIDNLSYLPNHGPHWLQVVDVGNLATRALQEAYIGPAVEIPDRVSRLSISCRGETPRGSALRLEFRTGTTDETVRRAQWQTVGESGVVTVTAAERRLQYRVTLVAGRGYATPYLTAVTIREAR